ncbi:histidine kinase [Actinophytocola algeriensis]|uniref:histidine kinase n=1 Tax=Actinophytocola algeriensis TaxID=1768010 RepID=A0A7W7VI68_9PSEU|nr:histidine kinase [Actinophytocola algeriensis]MBB4910979.1 signal transduction histidine kinase [Actinophytocola algeriensis]
MEATVTQSGAAVTARNAGWHGAPAPGASATFGFLASWSGTNPRPRPAWPPEECATLARMGREEPDWHRWRRPGPTPAQQRLDIGIAAAVLVGALGMTVLINSMGAFIFGAAPGLSEQLIWSVALPVPLVWRRRYPFAVLVVVSVLFIAAQVRQIGDNLIPSIVLFLAIYTEGAWERNRTIASWSRIGVIVVMFGWMVVSMILSLPWPDSTEFTDAAGPLDPMFASILYGFVFNVMFFAAAYWFGNLAWLSARRRAELEWRAEELRASQEQNTRGAIIAERVRIARDLHDVVAHHVSVMGVQAGAARRALDKDAGLARTALRTVEQTARTAIGELRGLLGVLRAEDSEQEDTTSPGLDRLPELVSSARSAGLEVRHGVYGEPRPVPEGVAVSAYRVVQEALTNVVKHAGARTAEVRVRYLDSTLEVEVTDDGRGAANRPDGNGFGLAGMRERVAVHGGELEAGPRRDVGYRVRASLPVGARPATEDGVT